MSELLRATIALQEDSIQMLDRKIERQTDRITTLETRNKLLEEVVLHSKRCLSDPSWGLYKVNLKAAILALKDKQEDEG